MTEPRGVGPVWLNENRFGVIAKSPQGVPDSAFQPMLQALLQKRFKLAAHVSRRKCQKSARSGVKCHCTRRLTAVLLFRAIDIAGRQ
jgi:hypothetical protein